MMGQKKAPVDSTNLSLENATINNYGIFFACGILPELGESADLTMLYQ